MTLCPKCNRKGLSNYVGTSRQAATERNEGHRSPLIFGDLCIYCGTWIKPYKPDTRPDFMTADEVRQRPTKDTYAHYQEIVKKHRVYIQRARKKGFPWKKVVLYLQSKENRAYTENSVIKHYEILRQSGKSKYFVEA